MAIVVTRQPNDTDDKLINRFRNTIRQADFITTIKERLNYMKPAAMRNRRNQSKQKRKPMSSY